jgi:NADPH:quinone reductase-like Zn-dependent oxidoreductase
MKTKTINIYEYAELSEEAKQKAYNKWSQGVDYGFELENRKTLNKFADIFNIRISEFQYDCHNKYIKYEINLGFDVLEMKGVRLSKYIWNNYKNNLFVGKSYYKTSVSGKHKRRKSKIILDDCCVLSGYFMDNEILEPIYNFLKSYDKEIDFETLLDNCLDSWLNACTNDYEYNFSEENFIENYASEKEYLIDGTEA